MSSYLDLLDGLWKIARCARQDGLDDYAVALATTYTEDKIRKGDVRSLREVEACWASFFDGYRHGKGDALRVCLCGRDYPTEAEIRAHMAQAHRNWAPEQVEAVATGRARRV